VVELVGGHRTDDAQFIGHGLEVGQGIREPDAALSVTGESPRSAQKLGRSGSEGEALALEEGIGAILPGALHQFGFVIEEIQMRRRTREMQVNHPLGFPGKPRAMRRQQ
jgi:hypothetical protein